MVFGVGGAFLYWGFMQWRFGTGILSRGQTSSLPIPISGNSIQQFISALHLFLSVQYLGVL